MCLKDAIEQGKLDPEKVFYTELPSRNIVSLKGAIEQNKWNLAEGKIVDPKTGREITIAEAIENKVIEPEIDADKALEQASSLKFLRYKIFHGEIVYIEIGHKHSVLKMENAIQKRSVSTQPRNVDIKETNI